MSNAIDDVIAERRRQVEVEGYTLDHDDDHGNGELPSAAAWLALPDEVKAVLDVNDLSFWPFDLVDCKQKDRRKELVQAAALLVAEIERIDRSHGL